MFSTTWWTNMRNSRRTKIKNVKVFLHVEIIELTEEEMKFEKFKNVFKFTFSIKLWKIKLKSFLILVTLWKSIKTVCVNISY